MVMMVMIVLLDMICGCCRCCRYCCIQCGDCRSSSDLRLMIRLRVVVWVHHTICMLVMLMVSMLIVVKMELMLGVVSVRGHCCCCDRLRNMVVVGVTVIVVILVVIEHCRAYICGRRGGCRAPGKLAIVRCVLLICCVITLRC